MPVRRSRLRAEGPTLWGAAAARYRISAVRFVCISGRSCDWRRGPHHWTVNVAGCSGYVTSRARRCRCTGLACRTGLAHRGRGTYCFGLAGCPSASICRLRRPLRLVARRILLAAAHSGRALAGCGTPADSVRTFIAGRDCSNGVRAAPPVLWWRLPAGLPPRPAAGSARGAPAPSTLVRTGCSSGR